MKIFSIVLVAALVAITLEKYLLIRVDEGKEIRNHRRSDCDTNPLTELNNDNSKIQSQRNQVANKTCELIRNELPNGGFARIKGRGDFVNFHNYKRGESQAYLGTPTIWRQGTATWDYATMRDIPEQFGICNTTGHLLYLKYLYTGQFVKIWARASHWGDYNWLTTSKISTGKWGYVWYDKLKPAGKDEQQTWIVVRDEPTDLTFHFKSVYWGGKKFLTAEEGKWVYHDFKDKSTKWLVTVNVSIN